MQPPKVSVIIPTKDEEKNLPCLFQSLKKQTFQNFEIIIIDNYSQDETINIAKKYTKKIFTAGPERSAQRNLGAEKASGEFLLFADADMRFQPEVIKNCVSILESNPKFSGVIIPEIGIGQGFWPKVKALEKRLYLGEKAIEAGRFFRRKAFFAVGGYKKNLIAGEDWDLSERIENKVGPLCRINTAILHDESTLSFLKDLKKKYYYAKYIERYAKKHPKRFREKSGLRRLEIFFRHSHELLKDPIHAIGLIFLKSIQFTIYLWTKRQK